MPTATGYGLGAWPHLEPLSVGLVLGSSIVALACLGCRGGSRVGEDAGTNARAPRTQSRGASAESSAVASSASLTAEQAAQVAASINALDAELAPEGKEGGGSVAADEISILDTLPMGAMLEGDARLLIAGLAGLGEHSLFERLCFQSADVFIVVDGPEKLNGRVSLREPKEAVRYARLFTSPATVKCLRQPWWYEVVPASLVDPDFLFGRRPEMPGMGKPDWPSGWFGVLSEADWEQSGLPRLRAESTPEGFAVTRSLVQFGYDCPKSHTVDVVRETVSPAGAVSRALVRRVALPSITLKVVLGE